MFPKAHVHAPLREKVFVVQTIFEFCFFKYINSN
jgi:hypothetical protein